MNETQAIIRAFDEAQGQNCALATVVSVAGSAYRRPGARMLVLASGASIGTISAGCLENDVIAHAQRVIETGAAKLVEYDTSSTNDEMAWGLGLGCNGVVRVLVEPLTSPSSSIYLAALRRSLAALSTAAIATVFHHTSQRASVAIGSRCIVDEDGRSICDIDDAELIVLIERDAHQAQMEGVSSEHLYETESGVTKVFIEAKVPPVPLVVFGAGIDAMPVVELASSLGFRIEVVDPQMRAASCERFAQADKVTLAQLRMVAERVSITSRTLTLLMTHNLRPISGKKLK
ncbi:MAG: XdhC family protein [Candidatus Obscuribacterales bacterium]|nr:XdhC family protein [Steroidobacteraceae bacterium]